MFRQALADFRGGVISKGEFIARILQEAIDGGYDQPQTVIDAWMRLELSSDERAAPDEYHYPGGPIGETTAGVPPPGQAYTQPFGQAITARPTETQAFRRFLSLSPFGRSPALAQSASALFPLASTQFGLQPTVTGEGFIPGQFGDFLSGGSFLRGEDLTQRLAKLAGGLGQLTYDPATGKPEMSIVPGGDPLGTALGERFGTAAGAFEAFMLPHIQQASGVGRDLLANAYNRYQTKWMADNPAASAADVAQLFGYSLPGTGNIAPAR